MKKSACLAILFVFILLTTNLFANSAARHHIKGKVIDKDNNAPMEYATVSLFNSIDSTLVSGVITDFNGLFDIQADNGSYYLTIQFMGYITKTVSNIKVDGNDVQLGKIYVLQDNALLEEVEVVAEKSTMNMTLDKRVFNVGKDVANTAGNAIEVLENVPSVTVDVEGNVSLRGDDGVQILIDGKVSGLVGVSTQDALRSLQSDMIEKIEVVTNPSVRYDAEGTAGIINIVLKKEKRRGFNGSIDVRGGLPIEWGKKFDTDDFPFQTGIGASLNYRLKRFNFYANYSLNYNDNISRNYTKTENYGAEHAYNPDDPNHDDAIALSEQETYRPRNRFGQTVRGGMDFYASDNDIISFGVMFRGGKGHNKPVVTYIDKDFLSNTSAYSRRAEDWFSRNPMQEYTLDYDKFFDTKDNYLKTSFRYFTINEHEWSDIEDSDFLTETDMNDNVNPLFLIKQNTDSHEKTHNFQGKTDFTYHIGQSVVEAGAKYNYRFTDNSMEVKQSDTLWNEFSHDFEFNQQVAAFYGIYGRDFGLFSAQLGLRGEYTYTYANLKSSNEDHKQNYFDLFPSGHLNYKLTETNQLQLSYARRIRRPGYWQMNPSHSFNDDRNFRVGNPTLKPIYTDSYEFTYLYFGSKGNFNLTGYYRHSRDVIRHFTTRIDSLTFVSSPENFGLSDDYGLELVGGYQFLKWLNLNGNINIFKSVTVGDHEGEHYVTDAFNAFGRVVAKFTFKKICNFQLTGHYHAPHDEPLGMRKADYWMDFAASRDVLKGNGTVTLNIRDVFGSRKHGGEDWNSTYWRYSDGSWGTTSITLNFNYRFNQNLNDKKMMERGQQEDTDDDTDAEF